MKYNLTELKWYAIDFDNTIVFTNPKDNFSLDKAIPNYKLITACRNAYKQGKRFIVYSSRHWDDYPIMEKWLKRHKFPFKFIICGKILVAGYIDDRNIMPDEFIKTWQEN